MMVDSRLTRRCEALHHQEGTAGPDLPLTVESLIESELRKLAETPPQESVETVAGKERSEERTESDEGFCDKSSTVTGPSSPDSLGGNLGMEEE